MSSLSCPKLSPSVYKPRKPEKTVLFNVVKKHYKTWVKNSEQLIPNYINSEFEKYLGCGILAKGFACAHCDSCNKDILIAFDCASYCTSFDLCVIFNFWLV
jgi:hypothetical protein